MAAVSTEYLWVESKLICVNVFISTRPTDLISGHLSRLKQDMEVLGLHHRIVVPHYNSFQLQEREALARGIEVIDVSAVDLGSANPIEFREHLRFLRGRPEGQLVLSRLMKMLNRRDFTGTYRELERESTVFESAIKTLHLLYSERPAAVVFLSTPHMFGEYLLFECAKFLGIKTLFFQSVPIAPLMLPHSDFGQPRKPVAGMTESSPVYEEIRNLAAQRIDAMLGGSPPPYITRQDSLAARARRGRGRLRAVVSLASWLRTPRFESAIDFSGMGSQTSLWKNFLKVYLNWEISRELKRRADRLPKVVDTSEFALFALHYEPEKTSLPDGLPVEFQLEAVLKAREILPVDTVLAVKEHSSQVSPSLRGYLGRSTSFYEIVQSLPNTVMVSPFVEAKSLFPRVSHVFTLTGTIALEAAAAGIPVGYFGSPWWQGLPGSHRLSFESDWIDLSAVETSGPEEVRSFLEQLLASGCIPGIAGEDPTDYVARNGPISPELLNDMSVSIAQEILALVTENA